MDQLGVGWGLNLYGFAGEKSIELLGDPFGLCVPFPACAERAVFLAATASSYVARVTDRLSLSGSDGVREAAVVGANFHELPSGSLGCQSP